MRRSSIITIILLVLVIIGLTVALVMTNLPKEKVEVNPGVEDVGNQNDDVNETSKTEEPRILDLNDELVKDMYGILNKGTTDFFHYFVKGEITKEDFTDEDIQTIAYFNSAIEKEEQLSESERTESRGYKLQRKYMDEAVKKIFGDIEYKHTGIRYQDHGINWNFIEYAEYDKDADVYYINVGFGGGGNSGPITAITKVEEYNDRYVVHEKLLFIEYNNNNFSVFPFYGTYFRFNRIIENNIPYDLSNLTNSKNVVAYNYNLESIDEKATKLVSKYYDYCTEYKHTFMKNEDGSYYWVKSEIIK